MVGLKEAPQILNGLLVLRPPPNGFEVALHDGVGQPVLQQKLIKEPTLA